LNIEVFMREYPQLIASDYGEDEFAAIRVLCPGLSTAKTGKILNRAVSYMDKDEIYCEIGTFLGYTLIAASHHNGGHKCFGIDNFRLIGMDRTEEHKAWARKRLLTNLEHFKYGNQFFVESDFRDIDLKDKMGVFYIDGEHTKEEVLDNFKWGHPRLSDKALIVIDDISAWGVGDGVREWLKDNPEYYEFFHMDCFYTADNVNHYNHIFWNGISLIKFERKLP
jgi:predicted O-methyltransferase YrrM